MKKAVIELGTLLQERYRVIRSLSGGGFSQTYEVDDGGTLKVLKVLKLSEFDSVQNRQKVISLFQQEAQVLKILRHPGIPQVESDGDFIFRPKGSWQPLHCLVMEKIEGKNLEQWLTDHGSISQEQAITWLKQLLEILAKIHQQRYFHRDIKPANIILQPNGQLVLIDFGAVRHITATYLAKVGSGHSGTQIISSGYTPPEQADGVALPQSDFFALGRTFIHLLTNKHPLDLRHPQTGELHWRQQVSNLDEPFANLLDEMMALSSGWRPASTFVILQRLDNLKSDQFFLPTATHFEQKNQLNKQRNYRDKLPLTLLALGGTILLMLAGISFQWAAPSIAIALNEQGKKYYAQEDWNQAKSYFIWATRLNHQDFAAYYNWGSVCENQGDVACAFENYETAVNGRYVKAFNNLGRLYILVRNDCKTGVSLLSQGLQKVQDDDQLKATLLKNLDKCKPEQLI